MNIGKSKPFKTQKVISLLITAIGISLLIYMIIIEDEPGAIPLLLILIGGGWYFYVLYRIKL